MLEESGQGARQFSCLASRTTMHSTFGVPSELAVHARRCYRCSTPLATIHYSFKHWLERLRMTVAHPEISTAGAWRTGTSTPSICRWCRRNRMYWHLLYVALTSLH